VGAGKLGYSIASHLSNEGYEVVVIDQDAAQLEAVKNTLDVLTIMANGASPTTMDDVEVRGADILIAVTASDEVNMVASSLAKQHKIRHTIARVRDADFSPAALEDLKRIFTIDLMLNPEMITAQEIFRTLMTPAALNVEDFASGKVRLFEGKVKKDSPMANIPLKDLNIPRSILAAMLFRDHRMIIPHGDDCLMPGDNAYFIGDPETVGEFSMAFSQREARKLERVMIIGASRTGRFLAPLFDAAGLQVKIIDMDQGRSQMAAAHLKTGLAICGDGTNIDLLMEEDVNHADVVICLTGDDKLNLMIALLAKHLGARETVVRVNRSEYVELMEKVGVDIALSARLLSAAEVLAYARRGGVVSVSLLEDAQAEAVEVIVQSGAPVAGRPLKDIQLPLECLVCAYVRGEEAFIPNGNSILQPGDRAILIIQTKFASKVMKYFKGRS